MKYKIILPYTRKFGNIDFDWMIENFGEPIALRTDGNDAGYYGPGWEMWISATYDYEEGVHYKTIVEFENKEHATLFKLKWL